MRLTSSSTPDSTPSSINRSSHVLITFGADPDSRRLTPCTLKATVSPIRTELQLDSLGS